MSSPNGSFPPPVRTGILDVRQGRCAGCDRPATEAHHRDPRGSVPADTLAIAAEEAQR